MMKFLKLPSWWFYITVISTLTHDLAEVNSKPTAGQSVGEETGTTK